ncbi:acyl-CoA thioesterase [Candidatus Aminicenantes bacterium AC-708-M15]|jgi:acyl-CoA hydrolase|nr:acyl-CoA thioesterase [SCandidatus Aminicenantes bacterium Aminicenantia_JdfR_composite]MCP2597433.1 acyl-CoA thioesterase [Candidatus Aminicenantes bacterium AC-335-G13]MCP2598617.1 acyl-CoA thioesterase [Candidatus Aminicenantes bacterium AC-335-L06]MCP2604375.1 acyl-CoA thioesterase [Candidatus Aminicenantes bacterium AC-708-M15]MCP2618748.1 acyl-CoA thioesterase [Candidatus Aminicenantes bacterium AC-335-A11]
MNAKKVKDSQVEMRELVLPNDTNPLGTILGGKVMHLMDVAAAMSAMKHSGRTVVTVSVDHIDFLSPIKMGQIIVIKASVNYVHRTSMEVGVKVWAEDFKTGRKTHTSSAYFTFVALDESGKPTPVPKIIPETEEEKRRYREAEKRREERLARKRI